jgi:hypothetical protein
VVPEAFSYQAFYSVAIDRLAYALLGYRQPKAGNSEGIPARQNRQASILRAFRPLEHEAEFGSIE